MQQETPAAAAPYNQQTAPVNQQPAPRGRSKAKIFLVITLALIALTAAVFAIVKLRYGTTDFNLIMQNTEDQEAELQKEVIEAAAEQERNAGKEYVLPEKLPVD